MGKRGTNIPSDKILNDEDVTRAAMRISMSAWAQLEEDRNTKSEVDLMKKYILLCPFVSSNSSAITAALIGLERVRDNDSIRMVEPASAPNHLSSAEATRAAMRVTVTTWSQLQIYSETMNDEEVMKKYVLLCPYVSPKSPATIAVLEEFGDKAHGPPELIDHNSDSDSEHGETPPPKTRSVTEAVKESHSKRSWALFRWAFLDIPLAIVFATLMALLWLHRVDELYLRQQIESAVWTDERAANEITYYHRPCDSNDMTTNNAIDLILPEDATAEEAYQHQLLHGFTVFPRVLTDETSDNLRNFVLSRKHNLTEEESIFVIENKNRFSFGLGTEEPSVVQAVMEIAQHKTFAPSLEKILGPDPALIEMTAITSSYGAIDQYWHDDVVATASAIKYARTFGPSYSLFIMLQNTTAEMGATAMCPGSHYCSDGSIEEMCDRDGFQFEGQDGHWRTGDALLMNMNSFHRGAAHVDPNGLDRVMMILTFVPKPTSRAESRQMSQGITFSLRWDMWGHTLNDLANAKTAMTQPWVTLRALGLYKRPNTDWGIDWITSASMRVANGDNGFRRDELDEFIERGGIKWLPKFLHGQVCEDCEEESWYEYGVDTLRRCIDFMIRVEIVAVVSTLFLFLLIGVVNDRPHFLRRFTVAFRRLFLLHIFIGLLWVTANRCVDQTGWAKDIVSGKRYANAFVDEESFNTQEQLAPTTFPHRQDVLIETRYGSRQFALYNDFINGHPGNRIFQDMLRGAANTFESYPKLFRDATLNYIVDAMKLTKSRFLHQGPYGSWLLMSKIDTMEYTKMQLVLESHPIVKALFQELRFLSSYYKYGILRHTSLAQVESVAYTKYLENRLLKEIGEEFSPILGNRNTSTVAKTPNLFFASKAVALMPPPTVDAEPSRSRQFKLPKPKDPIEPWRNSWLKEGDVIEAVETVNGQSHWYKGTIGKIAASGVTYVEYDDGTNGFAERGSVRRYQSYFIGEKLEVLDGEDYFDGKIISREDDGTYNVYVDGSDLLIHGVLGGDFRRTVRKPKFKRSKIKNKYV